ncbi:D-aspartate oxidase [Denticeps clupeoides]|uniref:D-aspartate oxidase n=1 Tax=Denticeps clupeoides TaxID=299321 RepID=A0AAY4AZT5_9TELE|nr:D-aspartate oxidase-like [Denticeps clupeoides]
MSGSGPHKTTIREATCRVKYDMTGPDAGQIHFVTAMAPVKVVVVGAGVIGLSTAVCLAENLPNCSVTIVSQHLSPNTTSDGAAGILITTEFPDVPVDRQLRWFKDTFDHLLAIAESSEAGKAGVFLSTGCQIFKEVPRDKKPYWSDVVLGFRTLTERELKRFPHHKFGHAFTTLKCECMSYLPWLEKRFRNAGGMIIQEKVTDLRSLASHFDIVINCSGLGCCSFLEDVDVEPIRGQVVHLHAPWVKNFIRDADGKTYIYPGMNSVILGGTRQVGDWRLEVDEVDRQGILARCCSLEPSLRGGHILREWVGLRPGRRSPRVEKEQIQLQDGRKVPVIHNYGHGGNGVTLSWGTALNVLRLVSQCIQHPPISRL